MDIQPTIMVLKGYLMALMEEAFMGKQLAPLVGAFMVAAYTDQVCLEKAAQVLAFMAKLIPAIGLGSTVITPLAVA